MNKKLLIVGLILISFNSAAEEYVIQESGLIYKQMWRDFDQVIPDATESTRLKSTYRNRNKKKYKSSRHYYDRSYKTTTHEDSGVWAEELMNDYIR